jgi:hypothetical protein
MSLFPWRMILLERLGVAVSHCFSVKAQRLFYPLLSHEPSLLRVVEGAERALRVLTGHLPFQILVLHHLLQRLGHLVEVVVREMVVVLIPVLQMLSHYHRLVIYSLEEAERGVVLLLESEEAVVEVIMVLVLLVVVLIPVREVMDTLPSLVEHYDP